MEIITRCPTCRTRLAFDPADSPSDGPACDRCRTRADFRPSDRLVREEIVDVCPCCGKRAFYVQRDFNRKMGLAVVVLCALAGLGFVAAGRPAFFYLSLGVGVGIDLLLYLILPQVTICYNCQAIFRDAKPNPEHGPFDLHIADHYEGRSQG